MAGPIGGFVAGSIVAKLLLDKTGWNASIKEVGKDKTSLTGMAKSIGSGFVQVGKIMAVAGIAAAGAIGAMVKKTADAGDAIYDMSVRTGVGARELSAYKLAAEKSGSSLEGLATGFRGLAGRMMDTKNGLLESKRAFDELGISVSDATGGLRPLNDVMLDVADRFAGMEDGASKAALAQDLFGRSGMTLIPMLNLGAEGLRKEAEMAERLGIVFDTKTAAAADRFNDTMTELGSALAGIRNTIANALIPVFNKLGEGMRDALAFIRGKIAEFIATGQLQEWAVAVARGFISAFRLMGKAVEGLILLLPSLKAAIFSIAEGFYGILSKIAEGASLIPGVSAQAGVALRVMAEDLKTFADTYGAAADENIEKASNIVAGFDALFETLDIVAASFDKVGQMSARTAKSFDSVKISTEELTRNVEALVTELEKAAAFEPIEIPIEMDLEGLGGQVDEATGIMTEFVAAGAAASAAAGEEAKRILDAHQALYTQVFADIINGFASIMDGSRAMGEFFSSIVTTMIADLGKLVIAEIIFAKKSIMAAQMESVAKFIASIFKKIPFPLNIALAAGAFGLVSKLFSKLLKFKEGGVFKEPTIAEVGHGTEYVLPERKLIDIVRDAMTLPAFTGTPAMAPAMAGAGGVTFNMYGPLVSTTGVSRRDLEAAGEDLARIVQFQLGRRVGRG